MKYIEEQLRKKQELWELKSKRKKALNQYFLDNPQTADKQKKEIEKRFSVNNLRSLRFLRRKMTIDEFKTICVIGRGASSEVRLVRKKDSKEVFAMKIMEKEEVIARGQVYQVLSELKVMKFANLGIEKLIYPKGISEVNQMIYSGGGKEGCDEQFRNSIHTPLLHYAFSDAKNLYFVMDFLPGGDLVNILMKYDVLNEDQCRFYIAEIALAINYVHSLGYVHRDMYDKNLYSLILINLIFSKPDNVLLDKFGHVRLADFGSCAKFKIGENKNEDGAYPLLFAEEGDIFYEGEYIYDPLKNGERRVCSCVFCYIFIFCIR